MPILGFKELKMLHLFIPQFPSVQAMQTQMRVDAYVMSRLYLQRMFATSVVSPLRHILSRATAMQGYNSLAVSFRKANVS
jgi:hypothetical protein